MCIFEYFCIVLSFLFVAFEFHCECFAFKSPRSISVSIVDVNISSMSAWIRDLHREWYAAINLIDSSFKMVILIAVCCKFKVL